jgi:hypothetical protein
MSFFDKLCRKRSFIVLLALLLLVALPSVLRLWTDEQLKTTSYLLMQRAMHAQWARLYGLDVASSLTAQPVAWVMANVLLLLLLPVTVVALVAPRELQGLSAPTLRDAGLRVLRVYAQEVGRVWLLLALVASIVLVAIALKLGGDGLGLSLQAVAGVLASSTFYVALGVAASLARRRSVAYIGLIGTLLALAALKVAAQTPTGVGHVAPGVHDGWLLAGTPAQWTAAAAIAVAEAGAVLAMAAWFGVLRGERGQARAPHVSSAVVASGSKGAWA